MNCAEPPPKHVIYARIVGTERKFEADIDETVEMFNVSIILSLTKIFKFMSRMQVEYAKSNSFFGYDALMLGGNKYVNVWTRVPTNGHLHVFILPRRSLLGIETPFDQIPRKYRLEYVQQ